MSNSIEKPRSILQREIEVDVRGLLGTLAKGGLQSLFGKWDDLAETGLELLDNLGLGRGREQVAGLLILKSLKRSIRTLLKENQDLILEQNPTLENYKHTDIKRFETSLLEELPEESWIMNSDFFQRPQNLPILEPVNRNLEQWLEQYLAPIDAKNLGKRLPSYFVLALNEEWQERSNDYMVLLEDETPFDGSIRQLQGWQKYRAYLQKK